MKYQKIKITHGTRLFESLSQAGSALGVSKAMLSLAKKQGCTAFKAGGRVNEAELMQWLSRNKIASGGEEAVKEKKLYEEWRRLKLANDVREGKLQDGAQLAEWLAKILTEARQILEQKLVNEYPALVENLDAPNIRVRGKKLFDDILAALRPLGERYATELTRCRR